METETQIEMMLTLHGELGADAAGMVICRGRIARIEPGSDPLPAVAATIAGYQRVHTQGNDLRRI